MAISNETIDERPQVVVFTSGRAFYVLGSTVYFSQIMEGNNIAMLGNCYQKNDPTAEQLSDLLATDGGTLSIEEAGTPYFIGKTKGGVIIFFDNGVWTVRSPDGGFDATNFSVDKITEEGATGRNVVVRVGEAFFYWSYSTVNVIAANQYGVLEASSISEDSIETFYNSISTGSKKYASGFYNSKSGDIEWYYRSAAPDESDSTDELRWVHDKGIFYNVRTQGWFPQSYPSALLESTQGESLIGGVDLSSIRSDAIWYVSLDVSIAGGTADYQIKTGQRDSTDFTDFSTSFDTAYFESGYDSLQKPSNAKSAPYTTTHFLQTEANWVSDGSGGLELDTQSGCQLRAKWDWNDTDANGRWSPAQQAYRFRRSFVPPSVAGPFDSGEQVISTKNKILGRGKALSIRFEQEAGKDMQLLGWTTQWTVKGRM